MAMMNGGESKLFTDFREAWGSRYPGSELPAAWEEDVRANLEKHETKVRSLKEELEKEEMYVEYLNNLLLDIENHRIEPGDETEGESPFVTVINVSSPLPEDKSSKKKPDFTTFQPKKNPMSPPPPAPLTPTKEEDRGQPDGVDHEPPSSNPEPHHGNKIKALRANWEKQLVPASIPPAPRKKPPPPKLRSNEQIKSRDSSDSEGQVPSPPHPSEERKKSKPKPKLPSEDDEPLYDTVAQEDEECYDNHLLYSTSLKSDTLSSADLGFDELKSSAQSGGSGTLSSSDTDGLGSSPLHRDPTLNEDEAGGNYVNIQYFLHRGARGGGTMNSSDVAQSDDELEDLPPPRRPRRIPGQADRLVTYTCVLNSVLDSESVYLEGLSVLLQYMKAMKVTLNTPNPVIPKEDFDVIFYKIPELHDLHFTFYNSLKKRVESLIANESTSTVNMTGSNSIGHSFKMLACRTKIYASFLNNYPKALEALHRSTESYPQFADLTRSIKLRSVKGLQRGQCMSLEDLLHKPVARVQKHCLCLQDLIKYSPSESPDLPSLNDALETVQNFLNEYNVSHAGELFPHQERQQRHLVKNSFIVELFEGNRKLRHLFLFNDVLVCAKYKASGGRSEKFTFQLKWYIPLCHALIVEEPSSEPKENSPANLVSLRTQAAALRDQILRIEKEEEWKGVKKGLVSKASEKHRKKLAEIESLLVLASPSLVFQVAHRQGKSYTFFLSSEYERSQWVETLHVLQSSLSANSGTTTPPIKDITMFELQSWITNCRKLLKTNMGSFLMRSPRDEPLLFGDLHFTVSSLQGLTRSSEIFVILEVDSYGHYFRKSKTKSILTSCPGDPTWNEEFIIELEGSENIRILVYEQGSSSPPTLRGRATLELSRSWISESEMEQRISMNDLVLTCNMKFVCFEETLRRVPDVKSSSGLFGTSISNLSKKEKRPIPFIVTTCVREVERRGLTEVGVYRVSGSAADVSRLRKAFETNPYEAEQLLKDCDIHSVAGVLKHYLRDLPESLFTSPIYQKLFEAYQDPDHDRRRNIYLTLFALIPSSPNQSCIQYLIEHMVRVSRFEAQNKMSLHNLATVFGPTMLHAGSERDKKGNKDMLLTTGTVDVMAQAGILHFFLTRKSNNETLQLVERKV
uniref:Active breakpoint cluster regionrelated proteinlike [Megachile rotundata] n=1 Tax=Lepeophtheirus salmonis TaxID=72036 RepID=A0A0K2TVS8_LEPSM